MSRAKGTFLFPANCITVLAMNPCPCGFLGSKIKRCNCSASDIQKYAKKISGPIMDRIDMWIKVSHIDYDTLSHSNTSISSDEIKEEIINARNFAKKRFETLGDNINLNKNISAKNISKHIPLSDSVYSLMKKISTNNSLSPRAYHRTLRVARTIADLEGKENVNESHILEAFQYRGKGFEE